MKSANGTNMNMDLDMKTVLLQKSEQKIVNITISIICILIVVICITIICILYI